MVMAIQQKQYIGLTGGASAVANAAGVTLTAAQLYNGIVNRTGAAAVTDTTDTAANLVAVIPQPVVASRFEVTIQNNNAGVLTLAPGAGVTFAGTLATVTIIQPGTALVCRGIATNVTLGTQAVTLYGQFIVGSTGTGASVTITQTAHGFTGGEDVYITPTGTLGLADASNVNKLPVGWISAIIDANTVVVSGVIPDVRTAAQWDSRTEAAADRGGGITKLVAGQFYFDSASTVGKITVTEPANYSSVVGVALADQLTMLRPTGYRPLSKISAASALYASFLRGHNTSNQTTGLSAGSPVQYPAIDQVSGPDISLNTATGIITLAAGKTYHLTSNAGVQFGAATSAVAVQWRNLTSAALIGTLVQANNFQQTGINQNNNIDCDAVITTTVITQVQLEIRSSTSLTAFGSAWFFAEVIAGNAPATAMIGATASLPGSAGFLPAPPAGAQSQILQGSGVWTSAVPGGYTKVTQPLVIVPAGASFAGAASPGTVVTPWSTSYTASGGTTVVTVTATFTDTSGSFNSSIYILRNGVVVGTGRPSFVNTTTNHYTITFSAIIPGDSGTNTYAVALGGTASTQTNANDSLNMLITEYGVVLSGNTVMTGATAVLAGAQGLVPQPAANQQGSILLGGQNLFTQNVTITDTATPSIQSIAADPLTINAGNGTLNLGTTGTGLITIGNFTGATNVSLNAGTGGINLGFNSSTPITIGAGSGVQTIQIGNATGSTALSLNGGTGGINVGAGAFAVPVTIGNATGNTSINMNVGTGPLNIGTFASVQAITVGNQTGATSVAIKTGTGGLAINGSVGAANATLISKGAGVAPAWGPILNDQAVSGFIDIGAMRIQWGSSTTAGGGGRTITLPAAFLNATYVATSTITTLFGTANALVPDIGTKTTTNFVVQYQQFNTGSSTITAAAGQSFDWICIGLHP